VARVHAHDGVGDGRGAGGAQVLRLARVMRVVRLFRGAHFQVLQGELLPPPLLFSCPPLSFVFFPLCALCLMIFNTRRHGDCERRTRPHVLLLAACCFAASRVLPRTALDEHVTRLLARPPQDLNKIVNACVDAVFPLLNAFLILFMFTLVCAILGPSLVPLRARALALAARVESSVARPRAACSSPCPAARARLAWRRGALGRLAPACRCMNAVSGAPPLTGGRADPARGPW